MDPLTIVEAIIAGLEIAYSITEIIGELQEVPSIIQTVNDQVDQMTYKLKHINYESKVRHLDSELKQEWIKYQKSYNKNLGSIKEILVKYSKRMRSRLAIFSSARFQYFGGKDDLDELLEDIKETDGYFDWLSVCMEKAPKTEGLLNGGTVENRGLSLAQHIKRVLAKEDLDEAKGSAKGSAI